MGRGTILADLGEGQYTIKLDFGESRLAAQLLLLTGANTELDTQIAAQQAKVNTAQTALNASNAALAAAIEAYIVGNSSPNLLPAVENAKLDQVAKEEALRTETVAIGKLQSAKANNLRKIDQLNSYRASLTLNAWCADYTEAASGEVATLEIPNEPKTVLIAPGGRAPVDADGELRMRALMTPPQAYYNAAILPGWQKFKPTYRSGVITAISGDTADVLLDEAKSSASDIADIGLVNVEFDVNQTSTLNAVPIVYQDCNAEVFEVGDPVVVQFMSQNWSTPRIIGFLSNPKECAVFNFQFYYNKTILGGGIPLGGRALNVNKKYLAKNGTFKPDVEINTTQTSQVGLPYSEFKVFGTTNDIFSTLSTYVPNILESGLAFFPNDSTLKWRQVLIKKNDFSNQITFNGFVAGHSLKKVDGDWYIFAAERFGLGSPFSGYNAQRILRSKLNDQGNAIGFEIIHEFFFNQNSVTGTALPNAGNVVYPVNFNSSCTQAVSLIADDNTAIVYTISGINVTASKEQLLPLTVTATSKSGQLVLAADYDNNDNLTLLKLSIEDTTVYTPNDPGDPSNEERTIAASTLNYGWGTLSFPARSFIVDWNSSYPDYKTVTNPANLTLHFWNPKVEIFTYSDFRAANGNASTTVAISGSYYYNTTKKYDYLTTNEARTFDSYNSTYLFFIQKISSQTSDSFAIAGSLFHYLGRGFTTRLSSASIAGISLSNVIFSSGLGSSNPVLDLQIPNIEASYYAVNSDGISMSQIRSAYGGSMTDISELFAKNHSIRLRFI
jgi:hypothetical protein